MKNNPAIVWTQNAKATYLDALSFILEKWSLKEAKNLEYLTNKLLAQLILNKKMCPKSNIKLIRKCVISSQTSLIYRITKNTIELIAFVDNRSKHSY